MAAVKNSSANTPRTNWTTTQAYVLAAVCLLLGGMVGYLLRGSSSNPATPSYAAQSPGADSGAMQQITPEMMKHMADKQAEPLLAKLKTNPNDADTLADVGNIYYDTQNFREAIGYYQQSLNLKDNANVRTDMGTAYWHLGDADSALREFEGALRVDPRHANTYYNMGIVRWQAKMDVQGAVSAWQKLLETNPDFPQKDKIEDLIARARQHANIKPGTKTDKPAL
jgi:tetratricopeptide (TPR) repeat protein